MLSAVLLKCDISLHHTCCSNPKPPSAFHRCENPVFYAFLFSKTKWNLTHSLTLSNMAAKQTQCTAGVSYQWQMSSQPDIHHQYLCIVQESLLKTGKREASCPPHIFSQLIFEVFLPTTNSAPTTLSVHLIPMLFDTNQVLIKVLLFNKKNNSKY